MHNAPAPLPHDPYANAVMAALAAEGLLDPDESWTEYASDNGVVMLMEATISLDTDRARNAGWTHGATLLWTQIDGWSWGPDTATAGRLQYTEPLITGTVVPAPENVVRAAAILLDGQAGASRLPVSGTARPAASTVPPAIQAALDEDAEAIDTDDYAPTSETLRQLAAYVAE
ncbi:DUF6292 family protein [Streptomyces filamentosus]|uniref:DUF6292 family protein n=1 Tax=Streptomyces filamentosus TaxID=67294 RepID=UPI0037D68971